MTRMHIKGFGFAIICWLVSGPNNASAQPYHNFCRVEIHLYDSKTGNEIPGVIRIKDEGGKLIQTPELLNRGVGLDEDYGAAWDSISSWYVIPETGGVAYFPAKEISIEAFCGIGSERSILKAELSSSKDTVIHIPVSFFDRQTVQRVYSANVHLHFKNISAALAHRYATEIPAADGLDLVFFSYLTRPGIDREYASNFYTRDSLDLLEEKTGLLFGYGEEYRNNFIHGGGGYGHVMFLPWSPVMRPASLGPGIMKTGYDDGNLSLAIDKAKEMGSTVLWCHNQMGYEDIPNWVHGKLDGQIIYDTGNEDKYEESFYRYLNSGIPVSFACGTDWFMSDMSATRVWLPEGVAFSIDNWLRYFRKGRTYITNGPVLELEINERIPGDTLYVHPGEVLKIKASVKSRNDFGKAEIVMNGRVILSSDSHYREGIYQVRIDENIMPDNSSWFALRIPQTVDTYKAPKMNEKYYNEYGKPLFAHTSPVYAFANNTAYIDESDIKSLIRELMDSLEKIRGRGVYSSNEEMEKTLEYYQQAISILSERMKSKH